MKRLSHKRPQVAPFKNISILASVGLIFVIWAIASTSEDTGSAWYQGVFLQAHIDTYKIIDSSYQRLAHKLLIALSALISISLYIVSCQKHLPGRIQASIGWMNKIIRPSLPVGFACLVLFIFAYGGNHKDQSFAGAGILLLLSTLYVAFPRHRIWLSFKWIALLVFAGGVFYFYIMGVLLPLYAVNLIDEQHLTGTLSYGHRIAIGHKLGIDVFPNYGVIWPFLIAAFEQTFSIKITTGQYIRLIQSLQLIFFTSLILLHKKLHKGSIAYILLPFFLIAPWLNTLHDSVWGPLNATAFRFLGFMIAILYLFLIKNSKSWKRPLLLGILSGFCLLYNSETGLAVLGGTIMYNVAKTERFHPKGILLDLMLLAFGVAVTLSLYEITFFAFFGYYPIILSPHTLHIFLAGFGGWEFYYHPLPILIFGHALYILFNSTRLRTRGPLSFNSGLKLFISILILVWGGYFFNRPCEWNLWSCVALYTFLAVDFIRFIKKIAVLSSKDGSFIKRMGRACSLPVLLFCLIIGPAAFSPFLTEWKSISRKHVAPLFQDETELNASYFQGVFRNTNKVETLLAKSEYISKFRNDDVVYFTADSFSIPLYTDFYPNIPHINAFARWNSVRAYQGGMAQLLKEQPAMIFLDAEHPHPGEKVFYDKMKKDIESTYAYSHTEHGWSVWKRNTLN